MSWFGAYSSWSLNHILNLKLTVNGAFPSPGNESADGSPWLHPRHVSNTNRYAS